MAAILGFMPAEDRRLSIVIRSGNAAKVVPIPATKPMISSNDIIPHPRIAAKYSHAQEIKQDEQLAPTPTDYSGQQHESSNLTRSFPG